jgi:hypothetical protein
MGAVNYNKRMLKDPKKITKSELRYLFRRVIVRIKQKPKGYFTLQKLRGACGYCNFDESIQIDYRKLLIPTLIHEILHDMYPLMYEQTVLRIESKLVNILTTEDIHRLLLVFLSKFRSNKRKKVFKKKKSIKRRQTR